MKNYSYAEKSKMMIDETIDALRNKPVKSTYYERLIVADKASQLYAGLAHPLYLGYCHNYVLQNVSCPIKPHDILVGRFEEHLPSDEEEIILADIAERKSLFMNDGGHCTFDWEEIVKIGLTGYVEKTEREIARRLAEGAEPDRVILLQGMNLVYKSYILYIARYAEAAEEAGLFEIANVCRNLTKRPPETFLEAMQFVLFIASVFSIYSASANATLCCGRLDDILNPFYERDIASGILTREDAGYIIDDFNCKSAIILGRGEHQMSGGSVNDTGWFRNPMYDSPTYVIIGGYSNNQDYKKNQLTKLFLERIHPRLENPVYVYRRTKDVNEEEWTIACDKLRQNSTLLIYNDETVIPSLTKVGVEDEDAINYTIHGCNWIDIQGKNKNSDTGGPIPQLIISSVFDENKKFRRNYTSIDEMYNDIGNEWRKILREKYESVRIAQNSPIVNNALQVVYCFMNGTIESTDTLSHACKYNFVLNLLRNIGTAADMMSGMETLLFGDDPVSLDTLSDALLANFVGYEDLWKRCKNAPKYGQDNDFVDKHAVRLMTMLTDINYEEAINPKTGVRDIYSPSVTITDMWHINKGRGIGATPDGRLAGAPLSENLSPAEGSTESVTALLNTVAKIPFDRISSGALNVRMPKNLVNGDDGLERIKILFDTYFENGGMQLQLSVADTAELRDAQQHPEKYPDLMVRITGYSAVFVDMCTNAQNEIIRRDEVQ